MADCGPGQTVRAAVPLEAKDQLKNGQAPGASGQFQIALKTSLDVFYFAVNYTASDLGGAPPPQMNGGGLLGLF